jgi:hypothetical protein
VLSSGRDGLDAPIGRCRAQWSGIRGIPDVVALAVARLLSLRCRRGGSGCAVAWQPGCAGVALEAAARNEYPGRAANPGHGRSSGWTRVDVLWAGQVRPRPGTKLAADRSRTRRSVLGQAGDAATGPKPGRYGGRWSACPAPTRTTRVTSDCSAWRPVGSPSPPPVPPPDVASASATAAMHGPPGRTAQNLMQRARPRLVELCSGARYTGSRSSLQMKAHRPRVHGPGIPEGLTLVTTCGSALLPQGPTLSPASTGRYSV